MSGNRDKLRLETWIARGANDGDPTTGAISTPIYQSATFRHPSLGETTGWDYTRQSNPTRTELEKSLALLEGAHAAFAFTSGMAAVSAILDLLSSGDHVLLSEDLYGGTWRLYNELARGRGISFDFIDTSDSAEVEAALRPATKLLFIETPSNPMMRVSDIAALSALAHGRGALLAVDNTFLSPFFQRPLSLGADIVVHSGTKFLAGHNDTLAGLLAVAAPAIAERLSLIQRTTGAPLAPFDSWLVLRGMKTLALRMERQQQNAQAIAEWLSSHPAVGKVHYVGLPGHPGYDLNRRQSTGSGSMISFSVKDAARVPLLLKSVRLILFAESLGGVESLITYPITQTHASMPESHRAKLGLDGHLLRLSVGIENDQDLIEDLDQALRAD